MFNWLLFIFFVRHQFCSDIPTIKFKKHYQGNSTEIDTKAQKNPFVDGKLVFECGCSILMIKL